MQGVGDCCLVLLEAAGVTAGLIPLSCRPPPHPAPPIHHPPPSPTHVSDQDLRIIQEPRLAARKAERQASRARKLRCEVCRGRIGDGEGIREPGQLLCVALLPRGRRSGRVCSEPTSLMQASQLNRNGLRWGASRIRSSLRTDTAANSCVSISDLMFEKKAYEL